LSAAASSAGRVEQALKRLKVETAKAKLAAWFAPISDAFAGAMIPATVAV
jgi:hypothetical protein